MSITFDKILQEIRSHYKKPDDLIPLHEPTFLGNERKYVLDAIDSTFVSSVGKFVTLFESMICDYTGSAHAVATVNGTSALHIALMISGVGQDDLVLTQPLSFIATCNAISYLGAQPAFIDIDQDTLGLSPEKLHLFLSEHCERRKGGCYHIATGKRIAACVPMHTYGHPVRLDRLVEICNEYSIPLIEDAAESMGSKYKNQHTGTFGLLGIFSFNGNKTITCGGGGVIITNNPELAKLAKHLTTQAKTVHPWEFNHDRVGYNYRLPNLNAALACAQIEIIDRLIVAKRALAEKYKSFFEGEDVEFVREPSNSYSNYWLNSVLFKDKDQRDAFLRYSNDRKIMTRPAWTLMTDLQMYSRCIRDDISNARMISNRLVNLPSSPILHEK
jgi:perosamine synthetase